MAAILSIIAGIAGAGINALAFSGTNYVFSKLSHGDTEKLRHDKAIEKL